ncbi:MAG: rRNA cytosine-C5-methyltransferase [Bacteroidia bacterium]|nr:rRNA cytosine-C5-methyltransferase [Bacteroidia bacterium]
MEANGLLQSLEDSSETCIRVNPLKNVQIDPNLVKQEIPWAGDAYILKERPFFAADPAFHAGAYYVQEASSTIVGWVVNELLQHMPAKAHVLDLCAAPGGKSTHMASVLRESDVLVANEVIQSRTPILHENLCKWGGANHIITRSDARNFGQYLGLFDLVLADMPCSGEGMFRKDSHAADEWSYNNVELCSARQLRIAHDIWPSIKPGGYLLYSTCTYNKLENEDNIHRICTELDGVVVSQNIPEKWNIFSAEDGMYRMMPHRTPGEGFFFAVIQKKGEFSAEKMPKKRPQKSPFKISNLFPEVQDFIFYERGSEVYVFRNSDFSQVEKLLLSLPMLYAPGTLVGNIFEKRHNTVFKPESSMALIGKLDLPFPIVNLDDKQIIKFLNRQSMSNPASEKGIHLVEWNQMKMGFLNGINMQWNNLWPMEWRLRAENVEAKTIAF